MHYKSHLHDPMYFMPTKQCGITAFWKDSPSAPPAPDYTGAAQATSQGNLDVAKYTTQANRANQYTPWGSLTWTNTPTSSVDQSGYDQAMATYQKQLNDYNNHVGDWAPTISSNGGNEQSMADPSTWWNGSTSPSTRGAPTAPNISNYTNTGPDHWTQTTTLTPQTQAALDSQMAVQQGRSTAAQTLINQVQSQISKPVDLSSVGDLKDMPTYDPSQATQFGTAAFNAQKAMLDPQYAQSEEKLRNNLALQGLSNSSEAFNNDMSNFNNSKNLAYNQLANQSLLTGQQVAQSNYNAALQGTQAQNQTQEQKIQELMSKYNTPINQLNSLLTGQQVQNPQFSSYAGQNQTAGPDMLSATGMQANYNQGIYNARSAATSSANSSTGAAIGTIAMAAMMY